jgi:dTDP-4-dehydrorhamnose 3,5-epimerase
MRVLPTAVNGVVLTESEVFPDSRGSFTTAYDLRELTDLGVDLVVAESHLVRSPRSGTLRGLHFQQTPSAQAKLVRCVRGRAFDVALDLRSHSPSFLCWCSTLLTEGDGRSIYIPAGCAHGYMTLDDQTDILYHVNAPYDPGRARGVRWNDPAFGIEWPSSPTLMAERDANYPDYVP